MILSFGGGSPFSFPLDSNNDHLNNQFPLSKAGPTSAHFFCSAISSKGPFNKRSCHLKQYNFFRGLDDVTVAACMSSFCFFDGKSSSQGSSRQETGKKVASLQDTFINNLFRRGRWTNTLLASNVL
ncbi:RHOMBOID-like protein 10 chloroplastic [Bienertia sinuspersici]